MADGQNDDTGEDHAGRQHRDRLLQAENQPGQAGGDDGHAGLDEEHGRQGHQAEQTQRPGAQTLVAGDQAFPGGRGVAGAELDERVLEQAGQEHEQDHADAVFGAGPG